MYDQEGQLFVTSDNMYSDVMRIKVSVFKVFGYSPIFKGNSYSDFL